MYRLIYTSTAKKLMNVHELEEILLTAKENNSLDGITGVLLYAKGSFFQVLEGQQDVVSKRLDIIRHDPRHFGLNVLIAKQVEKRDFPRWSMGFQDANRVTPDDAFFPVSANQPTLLDTSGLSSEVAATIRGFLAASAGHTAHPGLGVSDNASPHA